METKALNSVTQEHDRNSLSNAGFPKVAAIILSAGASFFSGCGPSTQAEWNEYAQKLPVVTPIEILEHPLDYMGKEVVISGSPVFVADHSYVDIKSKKHGHDYFALSLEYKLHTSDNDQENLPAWTMDKHRLNSGNYTTAGIAAMSTIYKLAEKPAKFVGEVAHDKDRASPYIIILHALTE